MFLRLAAAPLMGTGDALFDSTLFLLEFILRIV